MICDILYNFSHVHRSIYNKNTSIVGLLVPYKDLEEYWKNDINITNMYYLINCPSRVYD